MKKNYALIICVALLTVACSSSHARKPERVVSPEPQQICTEDARVCPDGHSVTRTGPNCTFAPCDQPQQKDIISEDNPGTENNAEGGGEPGNSGPAQGTATQGQNAPSGGATFGH